MNYKKVVVAGGGVLGSQIAFQTAYCGFDVTIWLRSEGSVKRCLPKLEALKRDYINDINHMAEDPSFVARGIADEDTFDKEECLKKVEAAFSGIKLIIDKKEAYQDADLIIESMAEVEEEKIAYYKDLAQYLPEKTVIVTNSSTLLPSTFPIIFGDKTLLRLCRSQKLTRSTSKKLSNLPMQFVWSHCQF